MSVSGSGPVVYALVYKQIMVVQFPLSTFFVALFVTCPDETIGFQCTNSLPEDDECTQASHYNITSLGVINLMGKMHCAPTKPATRRQMHT